MSAGRLLASILCIHPRLLLFIHLAPHARPELKAGTLEPGNIRGLPPQAMMLTVTAPFYVTPMIGTARGG